ncbi:hypothetical protein [uncultured Muribaculum sp.]|uniref:hypothetical protein n=1 Tax=uncultured Muribaculum sp. TaxID=1918613 RepID=UPI0026DEB763|nr:hypothetical protein [uncultured Muribaculum sp.]
MGEWLSDSTGHSITDREIGDGEIRLIELDLPRVTIKAGELRKLIDCLIERDYTEQPLYVYMTKHYKDAYVAYPLSVFYPMPHGVESDAIGYFYGNGIYFIVDKSVRNQVKTDKKECCHFEIYGFQTDMVFNYDPPMWEVKDIKSNPHRCRLFIDSSGMENNKAEIKSPL